MVEFHKEEVHGQVLVVEGVTGRERSTFMRRNEERSG